MLGVVTGQTDAKQFFEFVKKSIGFGLSPQVMAGALKASHSPYGFCHKIVNRFRTFVQATRCDKPSMDMLAYVIMWIGQICIRVGTGAFWVLGVPLIDDNLQGWSLALMLGECAAVCSALASVVFVFAKMIATLAASFATVAISKLYFVFVEGLRVRSCV